MSMRAAISSKLLGRFLEWKGVIWQDRGPEIHDGVPFIEYDYPDTIWSDIRSHGC